MSSENDKVNFDNENIDEDEKQQEEYDKIIKAEQEERSALKKIISFIKYYIFGQPDPYYEMKKLLKATEKKIKRISPVIYDFKKDKVTPKFVRIIYEIYKIVYPAKAHIDVLRKEKNKNIIQVHFIESNLKEEDRKILNTFTKEYVTQEILNKGFNKATKDISKRENQFIKSFNKNLIFESNRKYNALMDIVEIIAFDYYPFLKKFNKNLQEDYLVDNPSFSMAYGKYIVEDLKSLSDIIDNLDLNAPYVESVEEFSKFRNKQLVSPTDIERLVNILKKIIKEEYLPLLIKIIDKNPFYRPSEAKESVNIFQSYIKMLNKRIIDNINYAKEQQIKNQVNVILKKLFGTSEIHTLKNYVEDKNTMFERLGINTYSYAEPLNYLRYFIMEKYNRYIRETINSLIVGAKFYQSDTQKNLSNNFYSVNELIKEIMELDKSLNENEPRGSRFKMLLRKASNEAQAKKLSIEYISQINTEAYKILSSAIESLSYIIRIIDKIIEENKTKSNFTIVANLKEVEGVRNKEFIQNLDNSLNDMKMITQLIEIYLNFNKKAD